MNTTFCRGFYTLLSVLLISLVVFSGCAYLRGNGGESDETVVTGEETESGSLYYDFGDVPIYSNLKVVKKKSFVYHVPGFTAGVLGLSGRVDADTLEQFFKKSMPKDNWKLVCSFKSPRSVLFFTKEKKSCIINMTEKRFKTEVEIWVAANLEE
jgi:hypothetical protein